MKNNVIADIRIDKKCERGLLERGYRIIKAPPSPYLAPPVASHPDMLFFINDGILVCEKRYLEDNPEVVGEILEAGELELRAATEKFSDAYPYDVIFNAAQVGDRLICRKDSLSSSVRAMYGDERIINVKQGYSKCACVSVGNSGVITADKSVAKAVSNAGLDLLMLESHGARLCGYDTGFIGGCCGDDGENIVFCGSLGSHPEGERIAEFCRRHGHPPVSLSDETLYDYGSLIFF